MSVLSGLMDVNTPVTITMATFSALVILDMPYCQMAKLVLVSIRNDITYIATNCIYVLVKIHIKTVFICYKAICRAGCFNGGNCTSPEMCTCTSQWTGNNCTQGMKFYIIVIQ